MLWAEIAQSVHEMRIWTGEERADEAVASAKAKSRRCTFGNVWI
jgi:hypothetical protein